MDVVLRKGVINWTSFGSSYMTLFRKKKSLCIVLCKHTLHTRQQQQKIRKTRFLGKVGHYGNESVVFKVM